LVERAHATWTVAGQAFVMGLPNEQWGSRARALGYRPLFPLAWLRLPLRPDIALARRAGVNAAVGTTITAPLRVASWAWRAAHARRRKGAYQLTALTEAMKPELDDLWSRIAPSWPNAVVRDGGRVIWRYLRAEPSPYTVRAVRAGGSLAGYIAYRLEGLGSRRTGFIADICTGRGDNGAAFSLLRAAIDDLAAHGAATVATLAPPGSPQYGTLRRAGFLPRRRSIAFPVEMVPLQPSSSLEELRDPAGWLLTGGDFDVL
jgi:hypothetical protein